MNFCLAANGWSIKKIREDTPGCKKVLHLNNAGCALPCRQVTQAVEEFYKKESLYGGYECVEKFRSDVEKPYSKLGELLNCAPDEIGIVQSATTAWQQILFGLNLKPGDTILTTPKEYGSNFINFLQLQSRLGIQIAVIPEDGNGDLDFTKLEELMETKQPKLLAVTHTPTSSGSVYDAERAGQIAQSFSVPYILDACQTVGQIPIDVSAVQCDFLTATSRKYLRGPRGIGFVYAAKQTREWSESAMLDVRSARWISPDRYEIQPDARRFEQYEINFAAKVGFGVAVEYCLDLGISWIWNRVSYLADRLRSLLAEDSRVEVHDKSPVLCGIVSFTVVGRSSEDVKQNLSEQSINVSVSLKYSTLLKFNEEGLTSVVRASVHYYNTEEELEVFAAAVKKI